MKTKELREQHDELLGIVGQILPYLNNEDLETKSDEVAALLSTLTARIIAHLAYEDKTLYPALLASKNRTLKKIAERYTAEMGGISEAYMDFYDKWNEPSSIASAPSEFISDIRQIVDVLSLRITKENFSLYSLTDFMLE